jgi:endonuclease YncB( thermonuclease family)
LVCNVTGETHAKDPKANIAREVLTAMKMLLILTIFIFTAFTSFGQAPDAKQNADEIDESSIGTVLIEGKVISVQNGDTITVQKSGDDPYLVKMQAIDAPDIGQPYFENARKALSKLLLKKNVKVVVYTTYAKGMVIGSVFRDDRDVGLELVEKGMAWHFRRFAYQQPAAIRKSYSDAQDYAATAGLGLWSDDRPTPPWVFRGETGSTFATAGETTSGIVSDTARKYILGPRGGCYYVAKSGSKVYVRDKSLCGVKTAENKP